MRFKFFCKKCNKQFKKTSNEIMLTCKCPDCGEECDRNFEVSNDTVDEAFVSDAIRTMIYGTKGNIV